MTTEQPFKNRRDAILEMYEIGDSINVFQYAYRLCISLRLNTISEKDFDALTNELKFYCETNKIETENEICSLF
jgi:hypothetical protein